MPLVVYPFRFRDPLTGKWVRARHKAELSTIARHYADWEIVGPAELRATGGDAFNPHRKVVSHAELMRLEEPAPVLDPQRERPPAIDAIERFLVAVFLRRYVAYCARRRRYAAMNGAARLYAEIVAPAGADAAERP
jgi:hypothetical protein